MTRYSSTMTEALQEVREGFSSKQIKMAIGIASDKRYAGGNYTGAVNAIEKIKKGLSDHPQVAAVLKRQNEDLEEALPPHLAKLFDKDGNFKDPKKQKVFDRMMGDGIGKEIAQKMGRIKFRVQADSAKKKVMVYVDQNDESDAQKALKNHPAYVSGALRVIPEEVELEEKLGKDADAGDYIDDFKKSDAPQFKGKSDKKKKDMAIAAYLDAKDKKEEVEVDEEMRVFRVSSSKLQGNVHAKDEKEAEKIFRKKGAKGKITITDRGPVSKRIRRNVRNEFEIDEGMKYTHAAVDKKGLVIGFASDEKDAKDMAKRNDGKVVKLKKPMSDKKGDMMVNRPFKEEDEKKPDKPDSAKAVDQMRDDKKKTRIAQLQLQIAKATEMINKLNSQEKPDA